MRLPIFRPATAAAADFVDFWAAHWRKQDRANDERLYEPNISKPFTAERVMALFEWKNQMPLAAKKRRTAEKIIERLADLAALPRDTSPEDFLDRFKHGRAIWRIFLLHCWSHSYGDRKYPIYDQHVHRAMSYICEHRIEEIGEWNDAKKIDAYLNKYVDFFQGFRGCEPQKADQALMVFGRFVKSYKLVEPAS
ncbi:MAG: hypothetical protein P4M05_13285 [Bradyrhizobium sp.]|nr:hypothetical protein [Bradyrhizobium sp.]